MAESDSKKTKADEAVALSSGEESGTVCFNVMDIVVVEGTCGFVQSQRMNGHTKKNRRLLLIPKQR